MDIDAIDGDVGHKASSTVVVAVVAAAVAIFVLLLGHRVFLRASIGVLLCGETWKSAVAGAFDPPTSGSSGISNTGADGPGAKQQASGGM